MAGMSHASSMNRLVALLSRLPGIGKRSAERLAFHLLKQPVDEVKQLAQAITDLKLNTRQCSICHNVAETDPCPICCDPQRDRGLVLIVEQPNDLVSIEQTGMYKGVYHVLMGRIAPLDGIGPGDLTVQELLHRVSATEAPAIREAIIGTNPTLEGDGTALYLQRELAKLGVKVTRLARGLPHGSHMELVSKAVLTDALMGRQNVS